MCVDSVMSLSNLQHPWWMWSWCPDQLYSYISQQWDIQTTPSWTYVADHSDFVSVSCKNRLLLKLAKRQGQWLPWPVHSIQARSGWWQPSRCPGLSLNRSLEQWGDWCLAMGLGETDQAGLLAPINNFHVCKRSFFGSYFTINNTGIWWMKRKTHVLPRL